MIKKIGLAAGTSVLLMAAAVMPAFATFTLPNISGQINYVDSQSSAVANTGGNAQFVAIGPTQSLTPGLMSMDNRHHDESGSQGNTSDTTTSLKMTTGNAYAQSNSTVNITSTLQGNGQNGGYDSYRHSKTGGNTSIDLLGNVVLSKSQVGSYTGENYQFVGQTDGMVLPTVNTLGSGRGDWGHGSTGGLNMSSNTSLNMTTGEAQAVSNSTVTITAKNVNRSRVR